MSRTRYVTCVEDGIGKWHRIIIIIIIYHSDIQEKVSTLHLACHHGDIKTVQILLEAGAKVDTQDQVCISTPECLNLLL